MIDVNLSRKCNGTGQHDQLIHFDNGEKRLIQGVVYIWENEMLHIVDYLGVEYIINKHRVLFTERISRGGKGYEGITRSKPGNKQGSKSEKQSERVSGKVGTSRSSKKSRSGRKNEESL